MLGWSPCVPQRACMTSPWDGEVGKPVLGPPRITSTITHGTSAYAAYPMCSCISENPGPLVAVIAFLPANEAPITAAKDAISSSIWINRPPASGSKRAAAAIQPVGGGVFVDQLFQFGGAAVRSGGGER